MHCAFLSVIVDHCSISFCVYFKSDVMMLILKVKKREIIY